MTRVEAITSASAVGVDPTAVAQLNTESLARLRIVAPSILFGKPYPGDEFVFGHWAARQLPDDYGDVAPMNPQPCEVQRSCSSTDEEVIVTTSS